MCTLGFGEREGGTGARVGKEELYKDFCWFPENMAIVPKLAAVERKKNTKILATVEVVWTGVFDDDSGGTGRRGRGVRYDRL